MFVGGWEFLGFGANMNVFFSSQLVMWFLVGGHGSSMDISIISSLFARS